MYVPSAIKALLEVEIEAKLELRKTTNFGAVCEL